MFTYRIDDELSLALVNTRYSEDIFRLIEQSRNYLRQWMPWLDGTTSVKDINDFIASCLKEYVDQKSMTTVIIFNGQVAGIAGYNRIDRTNRIAYIGYWLGESYQGRGIMTRVCRTLVGYAFHDLGLNKVEIHAAKANLRSRGIPERLGFTREGTIRQSEWLYDHYVDHIVYGMLASEWE